MVPYLTRYAGLLVVFIIFGLLLLKHTLAWEEFIIMTLIHFMKWKHKCEIEEKFFGYELNTTSLEKYKKHRFFDINRVAMILFLFSRMPINLNSIKNIKSLENLIPNSTLAYKIKVNYVPVPTLIINIFSNSNSLDFYYNTIPFIH